MSSSYLVLEDGSVLEGEPFGHRGPAEGEVVFSTCMSGYQESLADPASGGQVIVMTYPLVGNYGVSGEFFSTRSLRARGLVVREYCKEPSPMYGGRTLDELLRRDGVPGISGIDTRDLAIRIRSAGTLRGALTEDEGGIDGLAKRLRLSPFPHERDLAGEASCKRISTHGSGKGVRMGVLDLGDGEGAMRALSRDFDVTVFPHDTPADVISAHKVKGLVVSDGPGDPSHPAILSTAARAVSDLSPLMPVFGMCLGGLVVAAAMGGATHKMRAGHRGGNQPVRYEGRVLITSQNHGFAVDPHRPGDDMVVDQVNVNDGTAEGARHRGLPLQTSMYRPSASPTPGGMPLPFDRFVKTVKGGSA